MGEPIEGEIDDRRSVQSKDLAEDEAADDGDAERATKFRADAGAEGERKSGQERGHGGHHDGAETEQAGFVNGIQRGLAFVALCVEREVDHHDGIFLDDTDEQDDADQRNDAELRFAQQ